MSLKHYENISKLFEYPSDDYFKLIIQARDSLDDNYKEAKSKLDEFAKLLPMQINEVQELYLKSFDVQAVTSLDIGYILYGDDYQRGLILANLTKEHEKVNNNCGSELSDYLPNLLRLLAKSDEKEFVEDLATMFITPALEKMIDEFEPSLLEAKNKLYKKQYKTLIVPRYSIQIFSHILHALYLILDNDFKLIKENKPFKDESFTAHLTSELEVQEGKQSSNSCNTVNCGGAC